VGHASACLILIFTKAAEVKRRQAEACPTGNSRNKELKDSIYKEQRNEKLSGMQSNLPKNLSPALLCVLCVKPLRFPR
jgi:hypothetical protein